MGNSTVPRWPDTHHRHGPTAVADRSHRAAPGERGTRAAHHRRRCGARRRPARLRLPPGLGVGIEPPVSPTTGFGRKPDPAGRARSIRRHRRLSPRPLHAETGRMSQTLVLSTTSYEHGKWIQLVLVERLRQPAELHRYLIQPSWREACPEVP